MSDPKGEIADGVLNLIGHTPVLRASRLDTGRCELFLKLECQNPGGSIKDRIALSMIAAAERAGEIGPGSTLVEATAGNTGLGLALVASRKGYRLILVIPDKMSQEKIQHLRALGAEIVTTRSDVEKGHPEYYQEVAERLARETPRGHYVNQFGNSANADAHEHGTAPELFAQLGGRVDAFVCGVGSGGTLAGFARFFARVSPRTEIILADPVGSVLAELVRSGKTLPAGSWLVEGIGEDFVPPLVDLKRISRAYSVSDSESFQAARELLRAEGILGGSSAGTLLAGALRYCREAREPKRVVTLVPDSGNKYLSKVFNDYWLAEQGLSSPSRHGDLRDLVGRRHAESAVASVKPEDTLLVAHHRMRLYEFSQLPVFDRGRVVGLLDESDILLAVRRDGRRFRNPVVEHMTRKLVKLGPRDSLAKLARLLDRGMTGILYFRGSFYGLITRSDLLAYLRRKALEEAS